MTTPEFIFDKQVAHVAKVSVSYISTMFKKGDKFVLRDGEIDLRKANPITIAGGRRWDPWKVAKVLNITVDRLMEMLK